MNNIFLISIFFILSTVASAGRRHQVPWNSEKISIFNSRYGKLYDTNAIEKVTGEITAVEEIQPIGHKWAGVHLKLKTSKENVSIHLGPSWYIRNQNIKLKRGDSISVKGSRIKLSNSSAVIAAQVKKGDQIMQLRNKNGVPYWCAGCLPSFEKF